MTTAFLTTSLFNLLVREAPGLLGRLRVVLFGGEMADPEAVRLLLASGPPSRLLQRLWSHRNDDVCPVVRGARAFPQAAVTVPVGRPIAGATAYVVDAFGAPVAAWNSRGVVYRRMQASRWDTLAMSN